MRPDTEAGDIRIGVDACQDVHPRFNVGALQGPDFALVGAAEAPEVAVLDTYDVRVAQRKVHLELDQALQRIHGVPGFRDHAEAAVEQIAADAEEKLGKDSLLAGEVPVHGRPADACRRPKILQRNPCEAILRKESRGR
ncbi:hypothetical protein StoSoilB13_38340 (plasmid) [Arthrobacter sp. StoSoilB13]|nr:hypothetical protein StoSoilB13_38340 [Arthrobacter sp. StoSoilB13]